jgi:uncharacterized protein (TIGR00369 family)
MSGKLFERVNQSFVRQGLMRHFEAQILAVKEGTCEILLPYSSKVTQQQGGFHGGAIGALADISAGYAGLTVAPEGHEVTTVEYKINFVNAYQGGSLLGVGKVLKGGKRLIVTSAEVFHIESEEDMVTRKKLCAILQQTLVPVTKTY